MKDFLPLFLFNVRGHKDTICSNSGFKCVSHYKNHNKILNNCGLKLCFSCVTQQCCITKCLVLSLTLENDQSVRWLPPHRHNRNQRVGKLCQWLQPNCRFTSFQELGTKTDQTSMARQDPWQRLSILLPEDQTTWLGFRHQWVILAYVMRTWWTALLDITEQGKYGIYINSVAAHIMDPK